MRGIAFFCNFRDFMNYEVDCTGLSELYSIIDLNQKYFCPGSSIYEEDTCQTSVSDVDIQHELCELY